MKIKNHGFYIDFCEGYCLVLRVCSIRNRDGTTRWVVLTPGEDKELSAHTKKRDAVDAAMAYLATEKLKGEIE